MFPPNLDEIELPCGEKISPITKDLLKSTKWDHEYHRMEIVVRLLARNEITVQEVEEALTAWCEDRVWNATVGS